jgi:hypothetical protein
MKIGKTNSLKINEFSGEGHVIIKEDFIWSTDPRERLDILGDWIHDLHGLYVQAFCEAYHENHPDGQCPDDFIDTTMDSVHFLANNIAQLINDIRLKGAEFVPLPHPKKGQQYPEFDNRVYPHETLSNAIQKTHDNLFLNFLELVKCLENGRLNKVKPVVLNFSKPRPRRNLKHQK